MNIIVKCMNIANRLINDKQDKRNFDELIKKIYYYLEEIDLLKEIR